MYQREGLQRRALDSRFELIRDYGGDREFGEPLPRTAITLHRPSHLPISTSLLIHVRCHAQHSLATSSKGFQVAGSVEVMVYGSRGALKLPNLTCPDSSAEKRDQEVSCRWTFLRSSAAGYQHLPQSLWTSRRLYTVMLANKADKTWLLI